MATKNDGGPAFPTDEYYDEKRYACAPGMSIRDYFAAAALPAVLEARCVSGLGTEQASIAEECWELADALLDARSR